MAPLDTKIVILSALVQKLWSKTSFCIMVDTDEIAQVVCVLYQGRQLDGLIWYRSISDLNYRPLSLM